MVYVLSKLYAYIPEFQSNVANQNNDQPKSINLTLRKHIQVFLFQSESYVQHAWFLLPLNNELSVMFEVFKIWAQDCFGHQLQQFFLPQLLLSFVTLSHSNT